MATVRLTDREIAELVRNVTQGPYREYVRLMLEIAVRERGSNVSVERLEEELKSLPYLNRSVAEHIVRDMEELAKTQAEQRA